MNWMISKVQKNDEEKLNDAKVQFSVSVIALNHHKKSFIGAEVSFLW